MPSLKNQTVSGLTWSFIDTFSNKGIMFLVGIALARLLLPGEFGLISMISIFIAISTSFMDSGFASALIRKKKCTNIDYSTVFYYNLLMGLCFYVILFLCAPAFSKFFNEPLLTDLIKVLGLVLIIDSFTIIQRTILTKRIDFKLQTRISIIASIISGGVGIGMAYKGFGVWSIVGMQLSQRGINSFLLWLWNRWRPLLVFSRESFIDMFSFGYKLLLSGLLDTLYRNINFLIIGKYFSSQELGYYTQANLFQSLPSQQLTGIISRVSYPVLSQMQEDKMLLKKSYQKLIKSVMLITFVLMLGMAAVAKPLIISLIGEQWRPSIQYLQLLCFVGMMYPLHALNLNMLNVKGRSDLFLRLEIIKKLLAVPVIIVGISLGIKAMIIGMILNSQLSYFLNSYWSGRLIGYPMKEQVKDIFPSLLVAIVMAGFVTGIGRLLPFGYFTVLLIQVLSGAVLVFAIAEIIRLDSYLFIKEILYTRLSKKGVSIL